MEGSYQEKLGIQRKGAQDGEKTEKLKVSPEVGKLQGETRDWASRAGPKKGL